MQHNTQNIHLTTSTHKLLVEIQEIFKQQDDDFKDIDIETVINILASGFLEGMQEDEHTIPPHN